VLFKRLLQAAGEGGGDEVGGDRAGAEDFPDGRSIAPVARVEMSAPSAAVFDLDRQAVQAGAERRDVVVERPRARLRLVVDRVVRAAAARLVAHAEQLELGVGCPGFPDAAEDRDHRVGDFEAGCVAARLRARVPARRGSPARAGPSPG
jgi:hypothetical protein